MFCPSCGNELQGSDNFCSTCGRKVDGHEVQTAIEKVSDEKEQEVIKSYFLVGYEYDKILCFLAKI